MGRALDDNHDKLLPNQFQDHDLASLRPKTCDCIACLFENKARIVVGACFDPLTCLISDSHQAYCCRIPGCQNQKCFPVGNSEALQRHERSHFDEDGYYYCLSRVKDYSPYHCCCENPFKRWNDLIRHYKTAHCKKPKEHTCGFPACKYHRNGKFGGFYRKDKLNDHIKNMHGGHVAPP